ncbi:MAG: hypothetical protein J6R96_00840, partial [Spirochaetaceae bacterium]|nr:hypothetical protein [Spirochaetaceae bacterium]
NNLRFHLGRDCSQDKESLVLRHRFLPHFAPLYVLYSGTLVVPVKNRFYSVASRFLLVFPSQVS